MRVKRSISGFYLILALVLSIAFLSVPLSLETGFPEFHWGVQVVVDNVVYHHHPPYPYGPVRENAKVVQGQTFIIRHLLAWSDPEYVGFFSLGIRWDSPRTDDAGTENENFTFVSASAYFENLDPISINVTFSEGVSPENSAMWTHVIVVDNPAGDERDGNFHVDVVMRASGFGGVLHIPGYHTIFYSGPLSVLEQDLIEDGVDPILLEVFPAVEAGISPSCQEGTPGGTLEYTITVANIGKNTYSFTLVAGDNASWNPTLSENLLENVGPGENRVITLSVTVPENATSFDEDNITVTATSVEYAEVSDSASCVARVQGKAEFQVVTLHKVSLDVDLYLGQGSKLVVKFYTWGYIFEGESIFENFIPPAHIVKFENVPHPENGQVHRAMLVLTDNEDNVIRTMATFTLRKSDLLKLISEIKGKWPFAQPSERPYLITMLSDIKGQWPFAPS